MADVKIKICGLKREEDIRYVNEARPDYCGFIIDVDKSTRNMTPDEVRALSQKLSDDIVPVGVFVDEPIKVIDGLLKDHTIRAVQLHGHEDEAYIRELRRCGTFPVIKAFRVPEGEGKAGIERFAGVVHASTADLVLIDQGGGGTGRTFDWSVAEKIRRPYFLAGGIGPDNVTEALSTLHPWGVDTSSKVETDGKKDRDKILDMVFKVRCFSRNDKGSKRSAGWHDQTEGDGKK